MDTVTIKDAHDALYKEGTDFHTKVQELFATHGNKFPNDFSKDQEQNLE